jgi:hypothetical protein
VQLEVPLGDGDGLGLVSGVRVGRPAGLEVPGLELGCALADRDADAEEDARGLPFPSGLVLALGR